MLNQISIYHNMLLVVLVRDLNIFIGSLVSIRFRSFATVATLKNQRFETHLCVGSNLKKCQGIKKLNIFLADTIFAGVAS